MGRLIRRCEKPRIADRSSATAVRRRSAVQTFVRAALLLALLLVPATAAEISQLPSVECLRVLRAARIAGMEGDLEREREILRAAIESFPREVAPVFALLAHHRTHPLPAEEHARFRDALAARLDDPAQDLPIGALQAVISDPASDEETIGLLERHFERRLATETADRPQLLHSLAILQDRLQKREAAVETLTRLREIETSTPIAWALYRNLIALGRIDSALAVFEELLQDDEEGNLRHTHVQLLGLAGRTDEQVRTIERYLRDSAGSGPSTKAWIQSLKSSAWDLRDEGKDSEAQTLFEMASNLDPTDQELRDLLVLLYGTKDERAALAAAERSQWQEEDDPRALFDRGTDKLASGDAAGALELLRRAAPELETMEAAWYNLGMAAYRAEDWPTAESAFERATKLNPTRAESHFFRGMALSQEQDCAGAVPALEKALELDAERTTAHYYLASCYRNLGDQAAADRHNRLFADSREQ